MSWDSGIHCPVIDKETINSDWKITKGDFSQEEARDWFIKFLACNPFFAAKLLIGKEKGTLAPIQEIIIRAWFSRKKNILIAGRGFSKSYTACIFIVLYAIFNPGAKIGIFSASFRQSKLIFNQIEQFIEESEAHFLKGCIQGRISHETDSHEMFIGKTSIKCLPLTLKTRGLRIQLLVVDEYLSVPEKIIQEIVKPMLSVKRKIKYDFEEYSGGEDILIKEGKLPEWDRMKTPENKTIMLSSASYEMDTLYQKVYRTMLLDINDPSIEDVSNSIIRLSWRCAPKHLDTKEIEEQQRSMSRAQFDREYNAIFTKETGGFYNMALIDAATVEFGEEPKMKLRGDPNKVYILGIDPNHGTGSDAADNFSIAVIELSNETDQGFLVHAYAMALSTMQKRTLYIKYLLKNFNIKLILADHSGGAKYIEEFIALHPDYAPILSEAAVDFDTDETFAATKHLYKPETGAMVFYQKFNIKNWIRDANETLNADIEAKRMMFAARIACDDVERERYLRMDLGPELEDLEFKFMDDRIKGEAKKMEFLDHVDERVENTKKELSLIEITTTAEGKMRFDLPKELRNKWTRDKVRRDSYTALLLANWGRHLYYKLRNAPVYAGEIYCGEWVS